MAILSAGVLLYRHTPGGICVLLVHPGGPFWRRKERGAWSIPKGEVAQGESAEAAARREFCEELGTPVNGPLQPLGEIRQSGRKHVAAFALEGDFDVARLRSNKFKLEWPPKSGAIKSFPEIDRAEWFSLPIAYEKILTGQRLFLARLEDMLARERRSGQTL